MKRIQLPFIIIVALLAIVTVLSCNIAGNRYNKKDDIKKEHKLDVPNNFILAGKLHNQALNYIYDNINGKTIKMLVNPNKNKQSKQIGKITKYNLNSVIKTSILNFAKTNKHLKNTTSIGKKVLSGFDFKTVQVRSLANMNKRINKLFVKRKLPSSSNSSSMNSDVSKMSSATNTKKKYYISAEQQNLLDKIDVVIQKNFNRSWSFSTLVKGLNKINHKARKDLSSKDATVIYLATSIGYHSYKYWSTNYKKWFKTMLEIKYQNKFKKAKQRGLLNPKVLAGGATVHPFLCCGEGGEGGEHHGVFGWFHNLFSGFTNWWHDHGKVFIDADIGGAVTGLFAGALVGAEGGTAFFPGPGTVTGAGAVGVVYGIYTGVGASAAADAVIVFNDAAFN